MQTWDKGLSLDPLMRFFLISLVDPQYDLVCKRSLATLIPVGSRSQLKHPLTFQAELGVLGVMIALTRFELPGCCKQTLRCASMASAVLSGAMGINQLAHHSSDSVQGCGPVYRPPESVQIPLLAVTQQTCER